MKKLIPALCLLLVSAVLMGTSTFAWFSMNKTVTATGMKVQATTAESLVIAGGTPVGTDVAYAFSTGSTILNPATHDDNYTSYPSGLKYVSNKDKVDAQTGLETSGATFTYSAANDGSEHFYKDFVVYVATSGKEAMSNKTLTFKFTDASIAAVASLENDGSNDTVKAFSADIYVETVTSAGAASTFSTSTFAGTLVYADAATDSVTMSGLTIPLNSATNSFMRVTFRIYLDGALDKTSGQAYVYNDIIDVTETTLNFEITVD